MLKFTCLCLACLLLFTAPLGAGAQEPSIPLRITEIMASNGVSLEDAFGRSPDWVEIHNPTKEPISLEGLCVSDKKDELERYTFPAGAVIAPDEYIIVFASGSKKDIADEYHTSFKFSASGEAAYLSKDGVVIDSVHFQDQPKDISLALDLDGQFKLTSTPTPYAANQITPVEGEFASEEED